MDHIVICSQHLATVVADDTSANAAPATALVSTLQEKPFTETIQILQDYFQSNDNGAAARRGSGILTYAEPVDYTLNGTTERRDRLYYADEFARVFGSVLPTLKTDSRESEEQRFLLDLYNRFIRPFKPDKGFDTSSQISESRDLDAYEPSPAKKIFSKNIHRRDGVCLFCWGTQIEAIHLVQPESRDGAGYGQSLLAAAGVDLNDVQNGVILCLNCRDMFYNLQLCIDATHNDRKRFLVKVVPSIHSRLPWSDIVKDFTVCREVRRKGFITSCSMPEVEWTDRQSDDTTGEMTISLKREAILKTT
ncbi:hypothetical protein HDU96_008168 [Phlyctochytrium bullatum]|nr:hypothetical protein HDU96_008168 [Phlyctochytrium bullatum]